MENSKRDDNYVPTLAGVDMTTGKLPTLLFVDETTHRLLVNAVITSMPAITIDTTGLATDTKQDSIITALGVVTFLRNDPVPDPYNVKGIMVGGYDGTDSGYFRPLYVSQQGYLSVEITNPNAADPATATNQTSGSQKTQICDINGTVASMTDGKLDVNASLNTTGLATDTKQDEALAELHKKTEPADNQQVELINALRAMLIALTNPPYLDKVDNSLKIKNPTVSVAANQTLATLTTLSNIGTFTGDYLNRVETVNAWSNTVRRLIT